MKRRLVVGAQKYLVNPLARVLSGRWSVTMLLETTGRRSGAPRRVPVGYVRDGGRVWVVAEHGESANYVRNIGAHPRVRLRVDRRWYEGTARTRPDVDPAGILERMTPLNAIPWRMAATDPLVVEIELDEG